MDASTWPSVCFSAALVLIGGAFAGLTIALMTQDETYLRVIASSGGPEDKENAQKVLALLDRGKHWILVTLLLGGCIASEALPVILDPILHGGLSAVIGSTILIVIFSEIIPQSICARHSLKVAACSVPYVSCIMYLMSPISWPVGKLLDLLVGGDHFVGYRRVELKTLFTLHKKMGQTEDRLIPDEVSIIHGTLGLMDKPVTRIMTPIKNVFSLSADAILDQYIINRIKARGYSRIPIHAPNNRMDIIGILPAKSLIRYKPKTCKRVYDFEWTPIPAIHAKTSCLNILKIFQERKYKMVVVGEKERNLVLGIVTRANLMEELMKEDTSDAFDERHDSEKIVLAHRPRTGIRKFIIKPQIMTVSAPEDELIPLWIKSNLPSSYGSLDYFNAASKWRTIQNYLSSTRQWQEIELGTTFETQTISGSSTEYMRD